MTKDFSLIIFDVGGVLRDSSHALDWAYQKAFEAVRLAYPFSAEDTSHLRGIEAFHHVPKFFRALLAIARSGTSLGGLLERQDAESAIEHIVDQHGEHADGGRVEAMEEAYDLAFNSAEAGEQVREFPDVLQSLSLLRQRYELAIFTNSRSETVARDLQDVVPLFAAIMGREHAARKPSGEGIRKVCSLLGIAPERTLYVGDGLVDVHAARAAGCSVAIVLTGMGLRRHIESAKPDFMFGSLAELARHFAVPNR